MISSRNKARLVPTLEVYLTSWIGGQNIWDAFLEAAVGGAEENEIIEEGQLQALEYFCDGSAERATRLHVCVGCLEASTCGEFRLSPEHGVRICNRDCNQQPFYSRYNPMASSDGATPRQWCQTSTAAPVTDRKKCAYQGRRALRWDEDRRPSGARTRKHLFAS